MVGLPIMPFTESESDGATYRVSGARRYGPVWPHRFFPTTVEREPTAPGVAVYAVRRVLPVSAGHPVSVPRANRTRRRASVHLFTLRGRVLPLITRVRSITAAAAVVVILLSFFGHVGAVAHCRAGYLSGGYCGGANLPNDMDTHDIGLASGNTI